jgi:LacI family transcriptional regulator
MKSPQRKPTISDVAREAQLALSTVSNALAGKRYVREETRAHVLAVAERLGYQASRVAQALRTGRSGAVGLLVADVSNPSMTDTVKGAETVLAKAGLMTLLCNTGGSEERQLDYMEMLLSRNVDGMILISQHVGPAVRKLLETVPHVLVQRRLPDGADYYVGSESRGAIESVLQHLTSLGHRRIAFVKGPVESSSASDRLAAFIDETRRRAIDVPADYIVAGDYSMQSGRSAAEKLLVLKNRPTAIVCTSDLTALGVLEYSEEAGLQVPDDLSVTGFDDISVVGLRRVGLTTVQQPRAEMGKKAAEVLAKLIEGKPVRQKNFELETRLVVRSTTGPAR